MGLLPDIAVGLDVWVPTAGHLISAYALGVVIGAPAIALLAAKLSRRNLLLILMLGFGLGNLLGAIAPNMLLLLTLSRFLSGLPHGAYFGVAALVAASIADAGRCAQSTGSQPSRSRRQGERSPTRLERADRANAPSRLIPPDQENPLGPCTSSASFDRDLRRANGIVASGT